ncbi:MAG: phosphoribosylglycinamide formyltransferase [Hyphomicrobiales bacterium]|nr:phosphoribosylglycinamide formyltransferase [Hyphomicrobiales bacterium]
MVSLIAAAKEPDFPAQIALVLSNRPDAPGLATAKAEGVPTAAVDHKIYAGREAFEGSLQKMLEAHRIDFICLAGFMRMLTPSFVERWQGRLINIHPALLPAYKGLHTHERALADGVKLHGCTVHYVVAEMDAGPIIAQAAVTVHDHDTPATLGARVLAQEHVIYPLALRLAAGGRLKIDGNRVLGGDGPEQTLVAPGV